MGTREVGALFSTVIQGPQGPSLMSSCSRERVEDPIFICWAWQWGTLLPHLSHWPELSLIPTSVQLVKKNSLAVDPKENELGVVRTWCCVCHRCRC